MNSLNYILIEGNISKDLNMIQTRTGRTICKFSIATDRFYRMGTETEKEVSYFDIETWDKLAEVCGRIGKKGRGCRIVGRLRQEKWNAPDGALRSKVVIVAETVEFKPERKES